MTRRFKWLIPILILCLLLMLVPCTGCTEGALVSLLVYAAICGVQVTIDGQYQGELEWVEEWGTCVLEFLWQEGESVLEFLIPGEKIAQLAAAHGMQLTANQVTEMPDMTLSYEGVIAHDGHLEIGIYHPIAFTTIASTTRLSTQNENKPPLLASIVVEISSEPFEAHPLIYPSISCEPSSFTVMLNPNTACSNTMRIGNEGDATLTYDLYDLSETITNELVYDDGEDDGGTAQTVYTSWWAVRFTPSSYPVSLDTAKIYLYSNWPDSDHEQFAVEVYDDYGAGGAPGSLLGTVYTTATNWGWWDVDISGLGITITSGDFYTAYHQLTQYPDCEALGIDMDEPHYHRSWSKYDEHAWEELPPQSDENYMIRCVVEASEDCPWLSENPKSGSVEPGTSEDITITIDASGLALGHYSAHIVISNNDPDENPTVVPVTLLVNNPPNALGNPVPANNAASVSINTDLSWASGDPDAGDTVAYEVYFGTSPSPPYEGTIGPYLASQSLATYDLGPLAHDATYYWNIIATDNHEVSAIGPVWDFITQAEAGRKGDFDSDGDIDIFDFVLFAAAYGSELGDDNYNPAGDFDNNDCIDIYDFVNFAAVYGT